jgi:hypothetical protein
MLLPKPARGSHVLEREAKRAEYEKALDEAKRRAKRRDGARCRWPEVHKCRGGLEGAHLKDASLGGAPHAMNIVTLCAWIHRSGPESIHGKQLAIEHETAYGADGPLAFYRNGTCVGVEITIGVLRKS